MNLAIVLGGLMILVALTVLIGRIDAHARDAAWRRIAAARRDVQERELALLRHSDTPVAPITPVVTPPAGSQ